MNLMNTTLPGVSQSWQDLQPGRLVDLRRSLQNYILDDLFGPPAVPTAHHVNTGSILQQVRFATHEAVASNARTPAVWMLC